MKFIMIFLSALLAVNAYADSRPAIIFLPGLYGSFLRDVVTKKRIYITFDEVMGGKDTLSLYQKELQTPAGPELETDGVLEKVVVIPGVYEIDMYAGMLDYLRAIPGHQVIPFAYDWRKDMSGTLLELDHLIDKLKAEGVKKIDLVGHSGGALISHYYMAYGTQQPENAVLNWAGASKIHRVALIGAPLQGCVCIFRDMNRGSTLPMLGHLMPQETISSYSFIWMTLPFNSNRAINEQGQAVSFPVEDVAFWKKNGFGLFDRFDLPADILKNRENFVAANLRRGRQYMDLQEFKGGGPDAPKSLKILSVVGRGNPTTDTFYFLKRSHGMETYFDTDNLASQGLTVDPLQVDGDGLVPAYSATEAKFLKPHVREISSTYEHDKLVLDPAVQKEVGKLITAP